MNERVVVMKLNQQQLELLDRTVRQGAAPDRVSLVRLALREYAARRRAASAKEERRK
jgi:metal-responsive CopG/Arc/MetJ family transcriptional regulator